MNEKTFQIFIGCILIDSKNITTFFIHMGEDSNN